VAASTVEAEYIGAAAAVKEALWFKKVAGDVGLEIGQSGGDKVAQASDCFAEVEAH
jgi:hypothetical protein